VHLGPQPRSPNPISLSPEQPECATPDRTRLKVEGVVNGGESRDESLSGRPENKI